MENKPVYYSQNDSSWSWRMYSRKGINDPKQTIGSSGCGPTCAAMIISTLTDPTVTPVQTCAWSVAHGYRTISQGTDWSYFVPQLAAYDIEARQTFSVEESIEALRTGKMVVGRAKKGLWTSGGHYILAWKLDGSTIYINDPNSTAKKRSEAPLANWKAEVTPFWIIDTLPAPDPTEEEEEMRYNTIDEIPSWAQDTIRKLCNREIIKGNTGLSDPSGYPTGLDLSLDMIRLLVFNDRARLYD